MNGPKDIAENYLTIGKGKTQLPAGKMFALAVLAGIYIALAGVGASCASATVTNPSLSKLIGACLFPAGLAMVLLAGSELFTGNCLLTIPLAEKTISLSKMLRSWIIVYAGNLIGAVLVAWLASKSGIFSFFDGKFAQSAVATAQAKCRLSFSESLIRGILCNILVCVAVWISFSAKDTAGKIIGLYFPVLLFVLCGYEHCVANMYYIPAGMFVQANDAYAALLSGSQGAITIGGFISNMVPVTLGNIIGGAGLGLIYWFIYLKGSKNG